MDGQDQELYNKCLFRTVSYEELKSKMIVRKINFSPSDSYYILTLKIRREILLKSDVNAQLVKNLDEEISSYYASKHTVGSRYRCCLVGCSYSCTNHSKYMNHLEFVHQNTPSRLTCQFRHNCERDFPSFSMLKAHVGNVHKKKTSSVALQQNQLVAEITKIKCPQSSCGQATFSRIDDLKTHLYSHTNKKEEVGCLFCSYKTNTTGSLSSHLSRNHKMQTVVQLNARIVVQTEEIASYSEADPIRDAWLNQDDVATPDDDSDQEVEDDCSETNSDDEEDMEEVFVKALAITVIKFLSF